MGASEIRQRQRLLDRNVQRTVRHHLQQRLENIPPRQDLRLHQALAPWVVLPAAVAVTYNQRYELLYPGALEAIGIPPGVYDSAQAWHRWLGCDT